MSKKSRLDVGFNCLITLHLTTNALTYTTSRGEISVTCTTIITSTIRPPTTSNFGLTFENKKIGNTTRTTPFYRISKDGFMLLVMGFTGEKAMKTKIDFINAFNWMAEQLTQITQSKWARYNQVSLDHKTRKQQVSFSARDMRAWRDDKVIFENELDQLEMELQPQLQCLN